MTFYILANQITSLFLSMQLLTTLTFDSEITGHLYGGAKEEVFFQVVNNRRTLVIQPRQKERFSNFMVMTRDRKYYFQFSYDEVSPHQFVEVRDGVMNHALKERLAMRDYQILEGESSLLFINRKKEAVKVNGQEVKDRAYFSKGAPLIAAGKRIFN